MTVLAELKVVGIPRPQGSRRAFVIPGKNGAKARAITTDAAGALGAQWRDAIAQAAKNLADDMFDSTVHSHNVPPFTGPLGLSVTFRFPMPKSRKKADQLRGIIYKTSAPDCSKLVRSLEDGLQAAGLIKDDALFCCVEATKVETTGWTGAVVVITRETNP